eukprot:g34897.t1
MGKTGPNASEKNHCQDKVANLDEEATPGHGTLGWKCSPDTDCLGSQHVSKWFFSDSALRPILSTDETSTLDKTTTSRRPLLRAETTTQGKGRHSGPPKPRIAFEDVVNAVVPVFPPALCDRRSALPEHSPPLRDGIQ